MLIEQVPQCIRRFFQPVIWRGNAKEKKIFLTFDDGPTPEITPWILDLLDTYNVKATFEGKNIKKSEVFIGNIESGATGSIDAMLEGKKISDGPAKVTMTLSYEDESGNISTTTKDLNLEVTEKVDDDEAAASDMPEETQKSFPVIPVVIAAVVIAVVAAVVILKKRKKKQLAEIEEEELLDELERSSEDEHQ